MNAPLEDVLMYRFLNAVEETYHRTAINAICGGVDAYSQIMKAKAQQQMAEDQAQRHRDLLKVKK